MADSKRTLYPTTLPTVSHLSAATRSAMDIADILLGCVTTILQVSSWSSINCGTWVDFPDPLWKEQGENKNADKQNCF